MSQNPERFRLLRRTFPGKHPLLLSYHLLALAPKFKQTKATWDEAELQLLAKIVEES